MTNESIKEIVNSLHKDIEDMCNRLLLNLSLIKMSNDDRSDEELEKQRIALNDIIRTLHSLYTEEEQPRRAKDHFDD